MSSAELFSSNGTDSRSGHRHRTVVGDEDVGCGDQAFMEPFGLLESLPADVIAEAERWREHLVEIATGLPPGAAPGTAARPGFDPNTTSQTDRLHAKAAELGIRPARSNANAPGSRRKGCGAWSTSAPPARSTSPVRPTRGWSRCCAS
ncbi:hypothetical protein [Actinosynnema sp. ALI-1.44]|uniref:hypothetical protein n=1 Tax=Actinosynnema sp. ALI-1.44 TaxID=1933779 RepID=UPI0011779784|nr:hypothetical protein [Actinosynnema sp. ALI-1.44]